MDDKLSAEAVKLRSSKICTFNSMSSLGGI